MERPVAVANWKTTRAKPCALRINSIDSTFARNRGSGNSWRTGFPMITTASSRLGGRARNRRRQCLIRGGDACGLTGCPKTDAVRPLVVDDHVHPSRQPRSVTLCIDWGIPTSAYCFLNSAGVTRCRPEQPHRSRARRRGCESFHDMLSRLIDGRERRAASGVRIEN
jgi:hypothetical protein